MDLDLRSLSLTFVILEDFFDHFSRSDKQAWFEKYFRPGAVLYLYCDFIDNPKEKYVVVVSVEPIILLTIINSKLSKFIIHNKEMMSHQIKIPVQEHSFLQYDSFLDCAKTYKVDYFYIRNQIIQDLRRIKGEVSKEVIQEIIDIVDSSERILVDDKMYIINQLMKL